MTATGMLYDQRGSDVIDDEECLKLLALAGAAGSVGRLALNAEGSPHVIPVNFHFNHEVILLRLGPGFAAHHLNGVRATFEVDSYEPFGRRGWSVVVHGKAELVTYEEVARLGRDLPEPAVMEPGMRVFSIRPDALSGRAVRHDHEHSDRPSAEWLALHHDGVPQVHARSTDHTETKFRGAQMELHLEDQQVKELHSLLTQALGDLSSEIADTDNPTFQRALRDRRLQLQMIEEQLHGTPVP